MSLIHGILRTLLMASAEKELGGGGNFTTKIF